MTRGVPLRRLAVVIAGQSPSSDDVTDFDGDGLPFLQGNAEFGFRFPSPIHRCDSAPRRSASNDVLLSVRAPVGALNVSDREYGIGRGLAAIRPLESLDVRYCWYWMHNAISDLRSVATGSTYDAVTAEDVGALHVPDIDSPTQRAIADFLDTETARIDALIANKRRMVELLDERFARELEHVVRDLASRYGEQPLKRQVREVTVGIVVTPSEWYASAGVPALRGINVKPRNLVLTDLVHITPEGHQLHRKSALRSGDVVVVRTGQAGAAAVVPPGLDGINCVDLLIVRPGDMHADFLEFVINSDWTRGHIDAHSVGSIQSHFNVSTLRELLVPSVPSEIQRNTADRLGRQFDLAKVTVAKLTRQIELLQEHRQALITASVAGELDIPGVAA